jgi:hypothetical protein
MILNDDGSAGAMQSMRDRRADFPDPAHHGANLSEGGAGIHHRIGKTPCKRATRLQALPDALHVAGRVQTFVSRSMDWARTIRSFFEISRFWRIGTQYFAAVISAMMEMAISGGVRAPT